MVLPSELQMPGKQLLSQSHPNAIDICAALIRQRFLPVCQGGLGSLYELTELRQGETIVYKCHAPEVMLHYVREPLIKEHESQVNSQN